MSPTLQSLGIPSPRHAAEIERELGIRFSDFTPEHCDTWREQTLYLYQFAQTRTTTHAARTAGITLAAARKWQSDNTLGFNQRLDDAFLEYTDDMEVLFLERTRQPDSPTSFMTTLLRAQMPEKYGPARRSAPSRDNHCDHEDNPKPETSHNDDDSLKDIRRDLQDLKQFAGLTKPDPVPQPNAADLSPTTEETTHPNLSPTGEENTTHSDLSPTGGETQRGGSPSAVNRHTPPFDEEDFAHRDLAHTPVGADSKPALVPSPTTEETTHPDLSHTDQAPVGAGFKPALVPSLTTEETQRGGTPHHPAPSTQNPSGLNRRQRRQLQRQSKRKHQNSNRPRAPNKHR